MKKLAGRTVKFSLVFLGLLVLGLLAAPFFINVSSYKSIIVEKAEQATGRKVTIGDIHASLFPWVGMQLDNVHIANRQGFTGKDILRAKSLNVQMALLPLLSRRVEIKRFVLDGPELLLERNERGEENWRDLVQPPGAAAPQAAGASAARAPSGVTASPRKGSMLAALSAQSLRVENGAIHYRDLQTGRGINLDEFNITVEDVQLERPVRVHASGKLAGAMFTVDGKVGPLGDPGAIRVASLPLQVSIKAKAVPVEKVAEFVPVLKRLGEGELGGDVRLEQRPDGLRISAGTIVLHGGHEVDLAWKFEMPKPERLNLEHAALRVDGRDVAGLNGTLQGIGHVLKYQLRLNTVAIQREQLSAWWPDLQPMYAAHPGPWEQLKLGLLAAGDMKHVELRDMQLMLDKELVQVSGNIRFGSIPDTRLRIAARTLHLDPWLPRPGNAAGAPVPVGKVGESSAGASIEPVRKQTAGTALPPGGGGAIGADVSLVPVRDQTTGARIVPPQVGASVAARQDQTNTQPVRQLPATSGPSTPIAVREPDLRFLKPWRVTAGLQVDHLFLYGLDLAHLQASLAGKGGIFRLNPLHFELAGGQVNEKASLTAGRYPVRWSESVHVSGVQLQPVLKALAGIDTIGGVAQMETKLNGTGLLPETAVRKLGGKGRILVRDGMIRGFDIAGILRNLTTPGRRGGPEQTDFSQLSGSFSIKSGTVHNDDLFMASPLFRLTGYGQIALADKRLDYHVKPRLVGTLIGQGDTETVRKGLVVPLHITGPLDSPRVRVEMDIKTLIGNVGGIKGILKGKKGGLKGILKGILKGAKPDAASPGQSAPPPASSQPASPADQIRKRLRELLPGF